MRKVLHAAFTLLWLTWGCSALAGNLAQKLPKLPRSEQERRAYKIFLEQRYGFSPGEITWGANFPVIIRGTDEAGFNPAVDCDNAPLDTRAKSDVIVVGAGPAGLTATFFLARAGKKILLLEKEPVVGGLAVGSNLLGGGAYGRGGAYFSSADGALEKVYDEIGMGDYTTTMTIPEPIDSYFWNGKYYRSLWDSEATLSALTADFAAFKYALQKLDDEGMIAVQPLEGDASTRVLDQLNFAAWTRQVPEDLKKRQEMGDSTAKSLLERLRADAAIDPKNPMKNVLGLLELYGRSALGDSPELISAAAFANFYISEIGERYSSNIGAGGITRVLWNQLKNNPNLNTKISAPVARVRNTASWVEVCYVENGISKRAIGSSAVFAAPLKVALKAIPELAASDPDKRDLIAALGYRHYQVINLHVAGHPWKDSYDLWIRDDKTYSKNDPTDIIDGRWIDFRGLALPRTDDKGVITVYNPLPADVVGKGYNTDVVLKLAERAAGTALQILNPLIAKRNPGQGPIRILAIEANRWPFSIHIAAPGHFINKSKILSRPVGGIYFASNNIGAPSIDEAVYRGHQAALAILGTEK
jgi:hypothetical protein